MQTPTDTDASHSEAQFEAQIRAAIDGKTKPVGALGGIETLAVQIAQIQKSLTHSLFCQRCCSRWIM